MPSVPHHYGCNCSDCEAAMYCDGFTGDYQEELCEEVPATHRTTSTMSEKSTILSEEVERLRELVGKLQDRIDALEGKKPVGYVMSPAAQRAAASIKTCYFCGATAFGPDTPPRCSRC